MTRSKPIYLDYNATTPVEPGVVEAMAPYLHALFGNPSSAHPYGAEARAGVEQARHQLATMIGCASGEVVFTGGGTESNNMAIIGAAERAGRRGGHLIISSIEHPAVIEPCRYLERRGFEVSVVPVDTHGRVDPEDVQRAMKADTILVSVMHANNEVGTMQPVAEIAAIARRHGALMHTDAAQTAGKCELKVDELGVDLLSIAGHKLYAPKGVGALYIRSGVTLERFLHGADHEQHRRAGTENVPAIVGLGEAARLTVDEGAAGSAHMATMRSRLLHGLESALEGKAEWQLNGHPTYCLPNTLSLSVKHIEASTLLAEIQDRVALSAGAACHADRVEMSHVLQAMHVPEAFGMGTMRISTGRMTSSHEVNEAARVIAEAILRHLSKHGPCSSK